MTIELDPKGLATTQIWNSPQLTVIVPSYNERENIAPLYDKVTAALGDIPFEFIVVDDNSPDGTAGLVKEMARRHANVRCIHRIGRRGLSSAVIEGISASASPYFAVIDADHQHDERILPQMLEKALSGDDIVVGTRYAGDGQVGEGLSKTREAGSRFATQLSHLVTGKSLSDPMSGFFLMRREVFDEVAGLLSNEGFKILLDIVVSASRIRRHQGRELRIGEVPYTFRQRHAGESKMSPLVVVQFLGLVVSKMTGGILPTSFLLFGAVGAIGIVVHMLTLWAVLNVTAFNFVNAQVVATLVSMTTNFILNNEFTFADKKLKGWRFVAGLLSFYVICSIGAIANVSVASWIFQLDKSAYFAGITGALMSVVFNYAVSRAITWRA
ncbi:MAG TPA: glycosyltransferase family 2 protein [Devosia sp.]|nr:glycosyltransferase family 2 protein [Devosia sp.]